MPRVTPTFHKQPTAERIRPFMEILLVFSLCFAGAAMAISLTVMLSHHTLHPSRITDHCFTRIFPNSSPNRDLQCRKSKTGFYLRHSFVVASTASRSPGVESPMVGEDTMNLMDTVKVFDLEGSGVPISDLWKDRKAVVAFARHFGCVLCRKRADYLASKKDVMDASGVALVLIGPGSIEQVGNFEHTESKNMLRKVPPFAICITVKMLQTPLPGHVSLAKTFAEQTKFGGEVYADPNHSSYEALKFVSGVSTTFTPNAGLKIIQLYMEGYRQDWKLSFERDTVSRGGWQQGGILVAGPGINNFSYIHKDKEAGDDPDIEDILKACCS